MHTAEQIVASHLNGLRLDSGLASRGSSSLRLRRLLSVGQDDFAGAFKELSEEFDALRSRLDVGLTQSLEGARQA